MEWRVLRNLETDIISMELVEGKKMGKYTVKTNDKKEIK